MSSIIVDGVRLDYVRKCHCGLRPEIVTAYQGMTPGDGPFIISCVHGKTIDYVTMSRSWTKTRAVENWNSMVKETPGRNSSDL